MTYLSIIEKLRILFNTLLDLEFVLVFAVLLLIFTFLYIIKKLNSRRYILLTFLSFVLVFGISIVNNYEILSSTFDNFATIFFGNIYFPSIYVYIGVLVVSFVAFITSMLNVMLKKIYKVINSIMFIINNIMFVIILNIIAKNKIDVFSVNSLYTNTTLVAILELSMGLCVLWILSLIAVYVTNVICERLSSKKVYNEKEQIEIFNPVLEVSSDIVTDVNTLNTDPEVIYEPVLTDDVKTDLIEESIECDIMSKDGIIQDTMVMEEESLVMTSDNKESVTFNDILNGCIPVTYYDNNVVNEEYNLINPQMIYEDNYNKIKSDIVFNDINIMLDKEEIKDMVTVNDNAEKDSVIVNSIDVKEDVLSVEELTQIEKEKVSEERLILNTVSLNDLIDEDFTARVEIKKQKNNMDALEIESEEQEKNNYTVSDYKKILKMLTEIKNHSNGTSINIDDAVALSLISNYSIDDCMKFKNILESNLN